MVDGRVVRRPRGGHRFYTQHLGLVNETWLNWRPGEALRWKAKIAGWEGQGEVCGKLAPSRL
jgi:hypothetical protein